MIYIAYDTEKETYFGFFLFQITSNDIFVTETPLSASFHHIRILKTAGVLNLKVTLLSVYENGFLST